MARIVDVGRRGLLGQYESVAHLAPAVRDLRLEADHARPLLGERTIWMINSTAQGGGVAEMLPAMVACIRELGIRAEWAVLESEDPEFFALTKRLHNMIHGAAGSAPTAAERELYERVNRQNAEALLPHVRDGDIVVAHDPQPMALAEQLRGERDIVAVWRCHIGLDEDTDSTRAAWDFLRQYAYSFHRAVFSAPEYIPEYLVGRSTVIYPAIDPLSAKNCDLHVHQLVGILANAALATAPGPVVTPPFDEPARRMQRNGSMRPANLSQDIGLLSRPIITQVSRWDRLKGYLPLLHAFADLKHRHRRDEYRGDAHHRRRLELVRLVLAGPDPASIQDDPEGLEVLDELCDAYRTLDPALQDDVAIVSLPMSSLRENGLMVNALQRVSSVVVQNSLREGFGLTITEAMWKRLPVLSNGRACGPRHQIRDGVDGRLVGDPEDTAALSAAMDDMLADAEGRDVWGQNGQRRVHEHFLITSQLSSWLSVLVETIQKASQR